MKEIRVDLPWVDRPFYLGERIMEHNETFRFGSAQMATDRDIAAARHFQCVDDGLFYGFRGRRPLIYGGMGGGLLVAGARSGKLTTILGYAACHGMSKQNIVFLDIKGEIAAISQYQLPDSKHCYYWNPLGLHGLPQNRLNPVDYIRKDSPSLVSDVKVLTENFVVSTGSAQGVYFEGRAREFLEGITLTLVELNGTLSLPDLYHVVNLIPGGGDAWLEFGFEMSQSQHGLARRVEEEIAAARNSESNGFQGIMGEIFRALAPLSDPVLMQAVSPPFDFSLRQLCVDDQRYQIYLMPPAEYMESWAPIIKAIWVSGMIYKSRAPQAPKQTWILDECGQLGKIPPCAKAFYLRGRYWDTAIRCVSKHIANGPTRRTRRGFDFLQCCLANLFCYP